MALRKSSQSKHRMAAPSALNGSSPIVVFGEHTTVAGEFAAADVVEMIPWPAGTILVSLKAHVQDLDSNGSPAVTLDFGVLTGIWNADLDEAGAARTCGTDFGNNLTTGQAGGTVDVTSDLLLGLAPSLKDRSIGFKIEAAPATLVAGAKIRVAALFAPAPLGVAFA